MSPNFTRRRFMHKPGKAIMKSYKFHIPRYDMPVRLRLWFVAFTCLIMITLAFLGFTNFARGLPLNDKLLRFVCFALATGVFYFVFDVEDDARRIWFWRHSNVMFTGFVCFFCGGILSEIVQSMLPYKEFQWGDVLANLLGSSLGIYTAYHLERYYRHRREIARLYRPLDTDPLSESEEDDEDGDLGGTQLLPLHHHHQQTTPKPKTPRMADVWDEREEVFGIGDSDDEDFGSARGGNGGGAPAAEAPRPRPEDIPKITITDAHA